MTGFCSACGAELDAGARFCSRCGAPVTVGEVPGDAAKEDASWVDLASGSGTAAAAAAPAAVPRPVPGDAVRADPPVMASHDAPRPIDHGNRRKLAWMIVLLVGIVGAVAIVGWAMQWSRGQAGSSVVADSGDDPAPSGVDAWQAAYRDTFVGAGEETLVTGGEARQRDFPTTEGTTVQRTLPAGTSVTGRWVRGRDPTTRWLKLASGGYVWEGNLAEPGGAGSPIALTISNRRPDFGPDVAAYLDQAEERQRAAFARLETMDPKERAELDETQIATTFVRVPGRRWRGLTVSAVALYYESHGVIFREDPATVRRALAAAGVRVQDDGVIPLPDEEAIGCSVEATARSPGARAYGATELICGV